MASAFDLDRFVAAQAPVFDHVTDELRHGRKRTHWMWFVFPQIAGLGHSAMAQHFAIASAAEAEAYLAHPLLGSRLLQCTALVNAVSPASALDIFGTPDDLKFHSSMTLFNRTGNEPIFSRALDLFYSGQEDQRTVSLLS